MCEEILNAIQLAENEKNCKNLTNSSRGLRFLSRGDLVEMKRAVDEDDIGSARQNC